MARRRRDRISLARACQLEALENRLLFTGTWTPLAHTAPDGAGTMDLLPDGSVIVAGGGENDWLHLVPDSTGSYINGTWTRLANSNDTRLYDATQVLPDGRLFVAGGEYGTGANTAETYNAQTNLWTRLPSQSYGSFIDAESMLLPDGTVLISPVRPSVSGYTTIFNPSTNAWSQGPKLYRGGSTDEQGFVKLPDGSILTIDSNSTSERYIPASYPGAGAAANTWINDGAVPVSMFDGLSEIGPGLRMSDGRVIYFGSTGNTAIYTPSGSLSPGTWVAGPTIPSSLGCDDAPAAMLPDGTILMTASPKGTYNGPTSYFIYTPSAAPGTGSFTSISGPVSEYNPAYTSRMLDLPNGQVLYADGGSQLYVYSPGTSPLAAAVPAISSLVAQSNGTLLLTGTGINGIDAGAMYGDDAQMDSNYPLVSFTSGTNVYYGKTSNWSLFGVATGSAPETATVALPVGIPAGTYQARVIANGVSSTATPITISLTSGNAAPTVAVAAAASPATVTGTSTALSALGADDAGEANLTYTWAVTSSPAFGILPSFSANGTNAAKNVTATFYQSGSYVFSVVITDQGGLSVSSSVNVTVNSTETSVTLSPSVAGVAGGATPTFYAYAYDQFGTFLSPQPKFTWSQLSGIGSITSTGQYTAPTSGGVASVQVTDGVFTKTLSVNVVSVPWQQTDVGATPATPGGASDTGGVFTSTGEGADIWGTADQFHYVYRTLTGDGSLTARVATQVNSNAWAKAGVMIRNSLSSSDVMALMLISPSNGADFQYRSLSGGSAVMATATGGIAAPHWVRIVRTGNVLTGYRSPDGINWTAGGSFTFTTLNATLYFGLAVCSHNTGAVGGATFDNVSLSQVTVATPAAANPATVTSTSSSLSVLGADAASSQGEAALSYTWAATTIPTGGGVNFTGATNGSNAAKNITANFTGAGNYTFTVTLTDGIVSTTSAVNVTVNPSLSSIVVSPAATSIAWGATQQYSAIGYDQFGVALASQPTFAWAVTGSGNSITSAGLLTADAFVGAYSVSAQSGSVVGQTPVTITAAAPQLVSAQVGDGSAQRSTVSSVTVTFDQAVTFTASSFTLQQSQDDSNWTAVSGGVTAANPSGDGKTWVLSCNVNGSLDRTAGLSVPKGFFVNGIYQLTLNGSAIASTQTGASYNGGQSQIAPFNYVDGSVRSAFHILFGDVYGRGIVNNACYLQFKNTYGSNNLGTGVYNALFDWDGNGAINNADYLRFKNDYGASYVYS